jgi:hypothetical protein
MNYLPAIAILVIGVTLLIFGVSANDSASSHVSNLFTGHPTDRTVWLLIGGALCSLVGVVGILRSRAVAP